MISGERLLLVFVDIGKIVDHQYFNFLFRHYDSGLTE